MSEQSKTILLEELEQWLSVENHKNQEYIRNIEKQQEIAKEVANNEQ